MGSGATPPYRVAIGKCHLAEHHLPPVAEREVAPVRRARGKTQLLRWSQTL